MTATAIDAESIHAKKHNLQNKMTGRSSYAAPAHTFLSMTILLPLFQFFLTGIVNCFHPELYRFTSFLSRKDIFQDVNCACHHLRAEFRKQMIVPGVLHTFRCPDIAAQKLIADTGVVCLAETVQHMVVQPVCPQASFLITGMGLTVHQAKDHQRAGTCAAYISLAHAAAETGTQPESCLFCDTAFF
jgi:hypothetical protein